MKVKSKKGSTMVEASMIFPIVIAAVMAVLYIVIALYSSLSLQTSLHLALRKECGNCPTRYIDQKKSKNLIMKKVSLIQEKASR